jgi:hypothetical protein
MYNPSQTKAAITAINQHSFVMLASRGATHGAHTPLDPLI